MNLHNTDVEPLDGSWRAQLNIFIQETAPDWKTKKEHDKFLAKVFNLSASTVRRAADGYGTISYTRRRIIKALEEEATIT